MTDEKIFSSTQDEKNLDLALQLITDAIPESQTDAMKNYAKALRFLYAVKDPRVQPFVSKLEDLYVYPERKEHNELMSSLSEFRETVLEEKLNKKLTANLAQEKAVSQPVKPKMTWKPVVTLFIVIMLLKVLKGD